MKLRRIALGSTIALLACSAIALARPGGGDSFGGGGGHSSGGGGGGGGAVVVLELIWWLLRICIYYPSIGLPLIALIVGYVLYSSWRQRKNRDWDSGPPVALHEAVTVTNLTGLDSDFSRIVFEDFAFRLFSTAQRARATEQQLLTVAPYVSQEARTSLASRSPVGEHVHQVVVGAMRIVSCEVPTLEHGAEAFVTLTVEFEANVATDSHTYYSVETWQFQRDAKRMSKPPGVARTFPCPNCGAPWQANATGTQVCASCRQVVDNGRFDWSVATITVDSIKDLPPTLTTETKERGNDLETYKAEDRAAQWDSLAAADPAVTEEALDRRLTMIYDRLNKAWASNELESIRGFVSDGLFDYLKYWVDEYKSQGLRNQLADMRITKVEYAKVTRDKYYDAVTIRLWGTGKDYVLVKETGRIVRGNKHTERAYSEYWTLIRHAGRQGAPKAEPVCGNCGAPLQVTQSGACEHCGAHVTAGEFDWVLSKIEQDDTYRG